MALPRQKVMKNRIRTQADFERVLQTICVDLAQANDHYMLFKNLMMAKEGSFTKAVSQSQTFWALTYRAHLDTALFRLCRAYDQNADALTLRTVVETIQKRPAFLPSPAPPLNEAELDAALASVSQESSQMVEHLMMWRHKVYAHKDSGKVISSRRLSDEYPITYNDVDALLSKGFDIVNRFSVAFFSRSYKPPIVGGDDYLKVLETLQQHAEAAEHGCNAPSEPFSSSKLSRA